MAKKVSEELLIEIEETQAALHDSIERAKELVCEARQVMLRQRDEAAEAAAPPETVEAEPPNPTV